MTTIAAGSRLNLAIVEEVTPNTTPATAMTTLRYNDTKLELKKETFRSDEHRSDRNISSIRHGMRTTDGSIDVEVSVGGHDLCYEGALASTWAAGVAATTITAVASGNKLTRATGSFVTDGYLAGDVIVTTGFTTPANNATMRIATVSALEIVVMTTGTFAKTLSNDTGGTINLKGKKLKAGTTLKTYSIEEGYLDVVQYRAFTGTAFNELTFTIAPKGIVKASFGFVGMDATSFQGTQIAASYTAAGTNEPLDAYQGALWEGGVANSLVTSATIKLTNGRTTEGVVGSAITPAIFEGRITVTGSVTVLFENATTYNKFREETATSLDILMKDNNGTDFMRVVVPKLKLNTGTLNVPLEGPIPVSMDFEGYLDSTAGCAIYMQRSNT